MRAALSPAAAAELVSDGATVMIGGFMGVGSPHRIIAALVARGARGLTVIANDTARPGVGIGRLITAGCVAKAVVALVAARSADYAGNLVYSLTARNFNPLMAMAADTVLAEPNEIVPLGVLPPDVIHTPGVLIDHLVERPQPA